MTRVLSIALLAFWFSATLHCGLEESGLGFSCASLAAGEHCRTDGCEQVERGTYRPAAEIARLRAPALRAMESLARSIALLELRAQLDAATANVPAFSRPQNWVTTWHFVRRAAPPSRAPTSTLA